MGVTLQILDADRLYSKLAPTRWEWLTVAHRGRLSADDKLAAALASGLTVRDAAAVADVAERTATRRMADAVFRRQVVELRSATVRSAAGKLADGMTAAADTLRGLLAHADDSLRLRAASKLLELGLKTWQVVDLESQVSELSERLALTEAMLDEPK